MIVCKSVLCKGSFFLDWWVLYVKVTHNSGIDKTFCKPVQAAGQGSRTVAVSFYFSSPSCAPEPRWLLSIFVAQFLFSSCHLSVVGDISLMRNQGGAASYLGLLTLSVAEYPQQFKFYHSKGWLPQTCWCNSAGLLGFLCPVLWRLYVTFLCMLADEVVGWLITSRQFIIMLSSDWSISTAFVVHDPGQPSELNPIFLQI